VSHRAIVLDANILIRAVLGKQVRELIFGNVETVKFFAPDVAYADARKYLPGLLKKRGIEPNAAMARYVELRRGAGNAGSGGLRPS